MEERTKLEFKDYSNVVDKETFDKYLLAREFLYKILDQCTIDTFRHPLNSILLFTSIESIKYTLWLSQIMPELEQKTSDYRTVLEYYKLCDTDKWDEAFDFTHVTYSYYASGFEVTYRPFETQNPDVPNPDIKLTNNETKEDLYLELTSFQGYTMDEHLRMWCFINDIIEKEGLYFLGKYSKRLKRKDINDLARIIFQLSLKCKHSSTIQNLTPNITLGYLEGKIYPRNRINEAVADRDNLRESKQLDIHLNQFKSLPVDMKKETKRMSRDIRKKFEQIENWGIGILYIRVSRIFMIGASSKDILNFVKSKLEKSKKVLAVILLALTTIT